MRVPWQVYPASLLEPPLLCCERVGVDELGASLVASKGGEYVAEANTQHLWGVPYRVRERYREGVFPKTLNFVVGGERRVRFCSSSGAQPIPNRTCVLCVVASMH